MSDTGKWMLFVLVMWLGILFFALTHAHATEETQQYELRPMVLICPAGMDRWACQPQTARDTVIGEPAKNATMCVMFGQFQLAPTAIAPKPEGAGADYALVGSDGQPKWVHAGDWIKIGCLRRKVSR